MVLSLHLTHCLSNISQHMFLFYVCCIHSLHETLLYWGQLNKNCFSQRRLMEFPGFANHHHVLLDQIPPEMFLIYFTAHGEIGLRNNILGSHSTY